MARRNSNNSNSNTVVEEALRKNEELLQFGARLELCDERENAARVYEMYVRNAAKISSTDEDVLELLYGADIYYQKKIRTYREAVEYATVAACAVQMMQLVLNYYPSPDWNESPAGRGVDLAADTFFRWLYNKSGLSIRDCEPILGMTALLEKNQKIKIEVSSKVDDRLLGRVIADVAKGYTRYTDRRLS